MSGTREKRTRRRDRAVLKHGQAAKPTHKLIGGRTNKIASTKIKTLIDARKRADGKRKRAPVVKTFRVEFVCCGQLYDLESPTASAAVRAAKAKRRAKR